MKLSHAKLLLTFAFNCKLRHYTLDTLVLNAVDINKLDAFEHTDYTPFDPTLKRTEAHIKVKASVGWCGLTPPTLVLHT